MKISIQLTLHRPRSYCSALHEALLDEFPDSLLDVNPVEGDEEEEVCILVDDLDFGEEVETVREILDETMEGMSDDDFEEDDVFDEYGW